MSKSDTTTTAQEAKKNTAKASKEDKNSPAKKADTKAKVAKPKTDTKAKKDAQSSKDQPSVIVDNTTFTITLKPEEIETARQSALQHAQAHVKVEGFRKGKAPIAMVEKQLDKQKLQELILERALPGAYQSYIEENKLNPLTEPSVKAKELTPEGEWSFEFQIAEAPEVTLGEYQKSVQKLKKDDELWKDMPEVDPKAEKEEQVKVAQQRANVRQQQVDALLRTLLDEIFIPVPELLVRQQTQEHLQQMGQQLEQMQMSLEDYLEKIGKSLEELQQETAARSLAGLQIEFLLGAIITQKDIKLSKEEIEAALPQDRQATDSDRRYVISMLLKQKAVDHLLSL